MDISLLRNIGLTDSEIKVYLALLELGSSTKGPIVKKSGVSSSKVYELLDKLINKGLVSSVIKAGSKHFEAAPPNRLMDYMEEKEKSIHNQKQDLKKIIPELELKRTISKYQSEATIYKGMKGVHTAFYDALKLMKRGQDVLVTGIPSRTKILNIFFVKWAKARQKLGINMKAIFNEEARGEPQTLPENVPLTEIKYMPETTPAAINIFNDRVIIFPESKEIFLIVIDSKEVAESFRVQFNLMWEQDVTVRKGMEEFKKVLYETIHATKRGESYDIMGAAFGPKYLEKKYLTFFRDLHKYRANKGVGARLIFYQRSAELVNQLQDELYNATNAEVKFLPYNVESPVEFFTANNKAYLTVQEKEPIIITIDNKKVADALKKQFEVIWNQNTNTYTTMKGAEASFEDILNTLSEGDEYYVFGISTFTPHFRKFVQNFHKKRAKKGIKCRVICNEIAKDIGEELAAIPLTQTRYIKKELFTPFVFIIYKDKVLISIALDEIFIQIKSKNLATGLKAYADYMWKIGK